jgi:riboflavin biosynthesis pyrimidine reductase
VEFQRLIPDPGVVQIEALLDSIESRELAPEHRPYAIVNFVSSVDGRATLQGRSGLLGDDGDHAIFHGLRERVDAVLAGTGTLAAERYGRILGKAERRGRRSQSGLSPEPLACVITRSGELPIDIPLFAEPEARIIVFSGHEVDPRQFAAGVEIHRLEPGESMLDEALEVLRHEHGVRTLLCEGGPTLFSSMLHRGVVDELFLTVAPKLAGGGLGPPISSGPELPEPASLQLRWVLERDGSLFLRYSL